MVLPAHAAGNVVVAYTSAQISSDPGFEGLWRYHVSLQWILQAEDRIPLVFYLDLREFEESCTSGDIVFDNPAGVLPGLDSGMGYCEAPYDGVYLCWRDRRVPFASLGGTAVFEPVIVETCLLPAASEGIVVFYSELPPGSSRTHYNALAVELPRDLVFGDVHGPLPQDPGGSDISEVVINEFVVVPAPGRESFYELRNQTAAPIALTNWVLATASGTLDNLGGVLPAGGYLADSVYTQLPPDKPGDISPDAAYGTSQSGEPFDHKGDAIGLYDPQQNLVDGVLYGTFGGAPVSCPLLLEPGLLPPFAPGGFSTSQGGDPDTAQTSTSRAPDGRDTDDHAQDFNVGQPTPGSSNTAQSPALGSSVRLNGVYAWSTGKDGVELFNPTVSTVDASGWYVSDGTAIDPVLHGSGVNGTIQADQSRSLYQGETASFNFSLQFDDVLYLYDQNLVRLDQLGWSRTPYYFPDSCIVRVPAGVGPADGYDWNTSGGDITLYYDDCPLMNPTVGIEIGAMLRPGLAAPMPNPAREKVALSFTLTGVGEMRARIALYDVSGRRIRTLGNGSEWGAGTHTVHWDGRDRAGRRAAAGIYFARLLVSGRPVGVSRSVVWLTP
jgi:hypothetical protein